MHYFLCLKSENMIDWLIDWLIHSFIHWFSMQVVSHDIVTSLQMIQSITNNQTLDNVKISIHKVYLVTIL